MFAFVILNMVINVNIAVTQIPERAGIAVGEIQKETHVTATINAHGK